MGKITFGTLNSANIEVNNMADEARVYDIKANVNLQGGNVGSVDSGRVYENDVEVATFHHWNDNNQQVIWMNTPSEKKCDVQAAIDAFVAAVKEEVISQTVTMSL